MVEILFDENISHKFAKSFNILDSGSCQIRSIKDFMEGAPDSKIIKFAEKQSDNCIIITSDKDFKKRDLHPLSRKSKNVGLFMFEFGNKASWERYLLMAKHWPEIRQKSLEEKAPFAYTVKRTKIIKMI